MDPADSAQREIVFFENINDPHYQFCFEEQESYMGMVKESRKLSNGPVQKFSKLFVERVARFGEESCQQFSVGIAEKENIRNNIGKISLASTMDMNLLLHCYTELFTSGVRDHHINESKLQQFVDAYNSILSRSDISPIAKSSWICWSMTLLHPFNDRNARMSLILLAAVLYRYDIPFLPIAPFSSSDKRNEFRVVLRESSFSGPMIVSNYLYRKLHCMWEQFHVYFESQCDDRPAVVGEESSPSLLKLLELGFAESDAQRALRQCEDDVDAAVDLLATESENMDILSQPSHGVKVSHEDECAICLDRSSSCNITMHCCGRPFHFHCVDRWLYNGQGTSSCPQCRSPIHFPQRVTPNGSDTVYDAHDIPYIFGDMFDNDSNDDASDERINGNPTRNSISMLLAALGGQPVHLLSPPSMQQYTQGQPHIPGSQGSNDSQSNDTWRLIAADMQSDIDFHISDNDDDDDDIPPLISDSSDED
mmetsp:Transcript_401/g.751  ORF Transcript_401/g.751 Transcript_401/m.751 type:complete len:479 (-) Transcript_401:200-1636(-)